MFHFGKYLRCQIPKRPRENVYGQYLYHFLLRHESTICRNIENYPHDSFDTYSRQENGEKKEGKHGHYRDYDVCMYVFFVTFIIGGK